MLDEESEKVGAITQEILSRTEISTATAPSGRARGVTTTSLNRPLAFSRRVASASFSSVSSSPTEIPAIPLTVPAVVFSLSRTVTSDTRAGNAAERGGRGKGGASNSGRVSGESTRGELLGGLVPGSPSPLSWPSRNIVKEHAARSTGLDGSHGRLDRAGVDRPAFRRTPTDQPGLPSVTACY